MSVIFLETERLTLRQFQSDEANLLVDLNSDAEVRRYLMMPDAPSRADAEETLTRFLDWYAKCTHYGYWAIEEKPDADFVGWFHFRPSRENPEEIEIGYRLKKASWGKGYATELTEACIGIAFTQWNIEKVVAITLPENTASRRVMEKAGMKFESEFLRDGHHPAVKYSLTRAEYHAQTSESN